MSEEKPNALASLTKYIPGFGGYAKKENRREDDRMTREFLARRLQECKISLEKRTLPLVEQGNLDAVAKSEKLRHKIELQQNRLRAAVEGYASWFDERQVDEDLLKQIAEMDENLIGVVDRLQSALSPKDPAADIDWPLAEEMVTLLSDRFSRRQATLQDRE
jgi:hypothetical protein